VDQFGIVGKAAMQKLKSFGGILKEATATDDYNPESNDEIGIQHHYGWKELKNGERGQSLSLPDQRHLQLRQSRSG